MKKALNILRTIFSWTLVIVSMGVMIFTIISVRTFDQREKSIFGYQAYIVQSDSMSATDFSAGDLILVKETEPETLKEGDIIAFISQNEHNYGETVTHKIRSVTTDSEGNPGFITYGTTTGADDESIVTYEHILGKYEKCIPKVGSFFQFLKTVPGYLIFILTPFMLLLVLEGINCIRLFKKYKQEQMKEIEAERQASAEMKKELLELKKQLAERQEEVPSAIE